MKTPLAVGLSFAVVIAGLAQEKTIGRIRAGAKGWSSVYTSNRSADGACRFEAIQVVKTLDETFPPLEKGMSSRDLTDPVDLEVRDEKTGVTFVYRLEGVSHTNTRTLEGQKERVTLRYKKCSVKRQ